MEISEKIYYLRKKHGLTLEQVGKMVGVGKSTVRKWECGDIKNMRRDKIAKLADALEVSPVYLLGYEDSPDAKKDPDQTVDQMFDANHNLKEVLLVPVGNSGLTVYVGTTRKLTAEETVDLITKLPKMIQAQK